MKYIKSVACTLFLLSAAFAVQAKAPQMVSIPAGSFQMGSCKATAAIAEENKKRAFLGQAPVSGSCGAIDSNAIDDETPKHTVNIRAFKLGKTEVTLGEFKAFIAGSGRTDLVNDDFINNNNRGDTAPVVMVKWQVANDYINWLNKTYGGGYRLPSEAEWEYACKAGEHTTYCGSNNADAVAWFDGNSRGQQHVVAQKQPNAFGLYDMSGNVWEWVQDCWHDNYNGAPSNGSPWTANCSRDVRVLRGGSWYYKEAGLRASRREYYAPVNRDTGFRVAQDLP